MYYFGFIGKSTNYYAIVTKFIDGVHPTSWKNKTDADLCRKALSEINKVGIQHGDARLPNFLIVTEEKDEISDTKYAVIIDFGFSSLFYKPIHENLIDDNKSSLTSNN